MFKNIDKKTLAKLVILQISIITVSNFLVSIPFEILKLKITWAAFTFPLIVVATDLTIRILGQSTARATIALSYPFAILTSITTLLIDDTLLSVA